MTDRTNQRLRELFDRAIELPAADRPAFLTRECGPDTELQRRLLAMIAAAEDEHFLAELTVAPGASMAAATGEQQAAEACLREGPGTRIGPYKLLQRIGEGGFGSWGPNGPLHRHRHLRHLIAAPSSR